jgi:DNA-binding transcriptional ArsR family regulator
MIEMRFGPRALAHVRFGISPLNELLRSVAVLDDPSGRALHLPWASEARRRTAGLDLAPLLALQPGPRYSPDFVDPPPSGPLAEIGDELAAVAATPAGQARAEILRAYPGDSLPAALAPFVDAPAALADLLRAYWDRALAGHWPRVRALLEGDVLYRARRMADGGAERLFADVDPTVRWADGVLRIDKRAQQTLDLSERGLLFVPSAFVWPAVRVVTDPHWQPTIIYPARGVGTLWEPDERAPAPEALGALLGRVRAEVLAALDRPRSTTDLARALGVTPGGVSQHLRVLREAGLVHGHRVGRVVLYLRSASGESLLAAPRAGA